MRTSNFAAALAALLLALASCKSVDDIERLHAPETPPIAGVGHGAFISPEGKRVTPTVDSVEQTQRYYLRQLYAASGQREKIGFKELRRELITSVKTPSPGERVMLNAVQINWLIAYGGIKEYGPTESILSLNTAVWGLLRVGDLTSPFGVRKDIFERLRPRFEIKPLFSSTVVGGPQYAEECRRAGVPLPPDWGSSQWRFTGTLGTNFLGGIADMHVFENDLGMCAALPRHDGRTIDLLGVICMGQRSSKTCYWDNQRNKSQFSIPLGTNISIVNDFAAGPDLRGGTGGMCTDCHAGENPYVVHPSDPAMNFPRGLPMFWPQPLVHPLWAQNWGPNTSLASIPLTGSDKSCLSCHTRPGGVDMRFPIVSTETPLYCGTVLGGAVGNTMPPGGNTTGYQKHIDALKDSCTKGRPGDGTVVVNGGTQADPVSGRTDVTVTLTSCAPGATDCPVGFCYWRALHGPFWQTSRAGIPPEDASYRGSFQRIFAEGGQWKARIFSDATGSAPIAPPGGVLECSVFNDLQGVTNGNASSGGAFAVSDSDGTRASQSLDVTLGASAAANIFPLTGIIGNVAHVFNNERSDILRVREDAGRVKLDHMHLLTPTTPYPVAPLTGESWTFASPGWTPLYLAKDVWSDNDVELVSSAQAGKARCYISGMAGAWSSVDRERGTQPYAEIYKAPSGEVRLRVWPNQGERRVRASSSCVSVK